MPTLTTVKAVDYTLGAMSLQGLACGREEKNTQIVLCLHGWLDNAASFVPLMPYLQQRLPDKYIVAIDWPGHGYSSHRSVDAHYHFIDWVYDLLQLFELNNWQQVDIIAHSMGGMVASVFAAAFPEKIKSLTLIDTIGLISAEAEQTTKQLRDGMTSRLKNAKQLRNKKKNFHPSIESAINARVAVSDLNHEQAKLLVERGLLKEAQGYRWRSDSRLRDISPYRLTLKQAQQLIADIQCPVQLIYGSKGMSLVHSGLKHYGQLLSPFSQHEVSGGHHVHMENPEKTAQLISYFFREY